MADLRPTVDRQTHLWTTDYWQRPGQHYFPDTDLIRFLIRRFPGTSASILELGCGTGNNTLVMEALGHKIACHDLAEHRTFARIKAALHRFDLRQQFKWPWDGEFDAVVDIRTLQHLTYSEHAHVLYEIRRVLKPGGWFFSVHLGNQCSDWKSGGVGGFE